MKTTIENAPVEDGRTIEPKAMEQIRIRAVAAVLRGHSPETVIDILGFSRSCICAWLDRYRAGGWEALRSPPLTGRSPHLGDCGKAWLKKTVLGSTPKEWGYLSALWTRAILVELVRERFEVEVSETTLGRYLHELGLSPQVPRWQASEQDPEEVRSFLEEKFPRIVGLARKIGAEIYFVDETGCRSSEHSGRTWGPVGETPVVESTGQRFGLQAISAISPEGKLRFKVIEHTMTSAEVIEFLAALLQDSQRPLIVLVDRHRMHFSARLREFAHPYRDRLKIYGLPRYSPECNPDEGVWVELKTHGLGRRSIQNKSDFKSNIYQTLWSLQKKTEKILSFFLRTPACVSLFATLV